MKNNFHNYYKPNSIFINNLISVREIKKMVIFAILGVLGDL